ncbi:MAG: GNAT family N-acetyltransferase [Thermomicrobiales bacterium]
MALRIQSAPAVSPNLRVRTLRDENVADLRLGWHARLQPDEIRRLLSMHRGRSVWSPETLEYAIVGPWRHRPEIGHLVDVSAVRNPEAVIDHVIVRCHDAGDAMVLAIELDEVRRPVFFDRIGFDLLEEVATYEWSGRATAALPPTAIRFDPVDPTNDADRALLLDLDHAAFPWLWRNSDLEFRAYGVTPGVEVFLCRLQGRPVGYVGLTCFPGWGHLDRIAIHPGYQGGGIGQAALGFAVERLLRRGARRVGLSTQDRNIRSKRLYERFGFRRVPANDYRIYGRLLRDLDGR